MNNKEKLEYISNKILNTSRTELYISMRFLDMALNGLDYRMFLQTTTIGTDGISILYNPRHLMNLFQDNPRNVNRAYLHMILHCIFRHMMKEVDECDLELWNLACDICVESIMDEMDYKCTNILINDNRTECYEYLKSKNKILTAESIFNTFKTEMQPLDRQIMWQREFIRDDHSIWERLNKKRSNNNNNNDNPIDNDENNENNDNIEDDNQNNDLRKLTDDEIEKLKDKWDKASDRMQTELETFGRESGHGTDVLTKYINIIKTNRNDYKEFLRKLMVEREEMKIDMDSFDYGFYMYGLELYKNVPLIEENEFSEVNKIEDLVIAIDTSKSVSDELVKKFLSETYNIIDNYNNMHRKINLHIIEADEEVREDFVISNLSELNKYKEQFVVKGGCGTDFRPVFEYVDSLVEDKRFNKLKGMIYFTDGMGQYPEKYPQYNTAFVFNKEDIYDDSKVPDWAEKLYFGNGARDEY